MVNKYEMIYVKGQNSIGKTQWMYQNLGCFPDRKCPDKLTNVPIEGYLYTINILPEPYKFPLYVYTGEKIRDEKNILQKLEKIACKILIHVSSYDLIIPVFRQLQKILLTELYINGFQWLKFQDMIQSDYRYYDLTTGMVKNEPLIFPQSLERIFFEVRTNDDQLIVEKSNGEPFVSENTVLSLQTGVITMLQSKLKKIEKKIQSWQPKLQIENQIHNLRIELSKIVAKRLENETFFTAFEKDIASGYKQSKKLDIEDTIIEITEKLQFRKSTFEAKDQVRTQLLEKEKDYETKIRGLEGELKRKTPSWEIEQLELDLATVRNELQAWRIPQ